MLVLAAIFILIKQDFQDCVTEHYHKLKQEIKMNRNIFETINVPLGDDDDNDELSSEGELSDEEEWIPPQVEELESESDDDDEDSPVYATLQPVSTTRINKQQPTSNLGELNETATDDSNHHNETSSTRIILGKDKQTEWHSKPFPESRTPCKNILKIPRNKTPGTQHVTTPEEAFLIYIDNNIIKTIVQHTNIEGSREKGQAWKNTDAIEIKAFIGCLLHTGALHQNGLSVELLFSPVDGNPFVRAAFSMKRFSHLLNHIRFDDKATRSARHERDRLAPIRDIWESFHTNLGKYFVPGESITVDEQLVPFKRRCKFIQYMPSKPDKYGMKLFWACDSSTNYPLRGCPYLGKEASSAKPAERNMSIAANIVTSLTHNFQGSGRNVTCDNYFTDLKLAESMAKSKLTLVGTIKRNKTFLPTHFQEKKALSLQDSNFLFRHETTLVSFQSKRNKNVVLLGTMHNKAAVSDDNGKPEIVLAYNKTKGGVDAMDQMAHAFTTKRKSKRWPLVYFFNILDLASIAALVVFRSKFPMDVLSQPDNRQRFNINVSRTLTIDQIQRRATVPTLQDSVKLNIATVLKALLPAEEPLSQPPPAKIARKADKQKRCTVCPAKKDRKTKTVCNNCQRHICQEHTISLCQNCS